MAEEKKRTIAMSGATGFVGSHLTRAFAAQGWEVLPLDRRAFQLRPAELAAKLKNVAAVINLAGAPVIARWSAEYKKNLRASRIDVTRALVAAFALLDPKPAAFLSTSAVGIYAASATQVHTEENGQLAADFLGHLCMDWEAAAKEAVALGIRTAILRLGIVFGRNGGALQQMLPPFRLGLGGPIGNGTQPVSWIHIEDVARVFLQAATDPTFEGIYNLTAPQPTDNNGLTKALGRALGRPTLLRIPPFILWLRFGEGARILTTGQTVLPKRLLDAGFNFAFADLEFAMRNCVA
ncbi:MAG: TIGR01777 family protein [Deltaproteobacteria bacterium RIFOXYD12_FULL_57_12]|nr:MAG: TIGR01777 family protein [Deltaproteobacteria bacterium RIFOXYD12_FULL_57_12]